MLTAVKDMKCKKDTLTFVPTSKQKGLIRVYPLDEASTCQPIGALYQNTQRIAMLNLGIEKVRITKGTPIARFSYVNRNPLGLQPRDERVEEVRMETDITPGSTEEEAKLTELWQQLKLEENPLLADP